MSIKAANHQELVKHRLRTSHANGPSSATRYGRNTFGERQRSSPLRPCFTTRRTASAPPPRTPQARVRALGTHRRTTSQTGYSLDRTQHDLAGRLVAKNATLTRARFRYGGQMTLDIRSMPFPKRQHMRGLRRARKGLLSCLGWRRPKFGRVPSRSALWARRTTAETMKAMSRICLTPESCGPVGDRAAEEVGDQAGGQRPDGHLCCARHYQPVPARWLA